MREKPIVPLLSDYSYNTFSTVVQHLDTLSHERLPNFFGQIMDFSKLMLGPLEKFLELPSELPMNPNSSQNALLKAGLLLREGRIEKAIPVYEETVRYFDEFENLRTLKRVFKKHLSIYAIYKLWVPGLVTLKDLQAFSGKKLNQLSNTIASLEKLRVLKRKTRGIYGRGDNGKLVMNLFALIVALWRTISDNIPNVAAFNIASPVRFQLQNGFIIIDQQEQVPVPIQLVPQMDPILVEVSNRLVKYLSATALSYAFFEATRNFLDKAVGHGVPLGSRNLVFQEGELVSSRMKVRTALSKSISERKMLFLQKADCFYYIPASSSHFGFW